MSNQQKETSSLVHFPANKSLLAKQRINSHSVAYECEAASSSADIHAASLSSTSPLFEFVDELSLSPSDYEEVDNALEHLNFMTSELSGSYQNLEKRVHQLKGELHVETEQKHQELKEKEALANRLSTLLEVLPAGVVLLDGKGLISEFNPAAIELLGEPLEGEPWVNVINRCFAPRSDDGHEVSLKDGRRVRIETTSMQNMPGQLILLSDLTETRELQAKVSRAERLSSLGKMVASLAHQIRTPLSTAMLYAGHLCQPDVSDELRIKSAGKLKSRLIHLERQIRDMLIFAKGETRLAEQLSVSKLMDLLEQATESPIANACAQVKWVDKSQGVSILCNREALIGALLNLVNNSIDAAESTPEIVIRAISPGTGFVNLEVIDNGPGFNEKDKEKIFEPFFTTKSQGTGLGLAVVQAVTHAHHGKFYISTRQTEHINQNNKGVRAVMTLPVCVKKGAGASTRGVE